MWDLLSAPLSRVLSIKGLQHCSFRRPRRREPKGEPAAVRGPGDTTPNPTTTPRLEQPVDVFSTLGSVALSHSFPLVLTPFLCFVFPPRAHHSSFQLAT